MGLALRRIASSAIDLLFVMALTAIPVLLVPVLIFKYPATLSGASSSFDRALMFPIPLLIYVLVCTVLFGGRTLGKRICLLPAPTFRGKPVGVIRSVIRVWLPVEFLVLVSTLGMDKLFRDAVLSSLGSLTIWVSLASFGFPIGLFMISLFLSRGAVGPHDLICRTRIGSLQVIGQARARLAASSIAWSIIALLILGPVCQFAVDIGAQYSDSYSETKALRSVILRFFSSKVSPPVKVDLGTGYGYGFYVDQIPETAHVIKDAALFKKGMMFLGYEIQAKNGELAKGEVNRKQILRDFVQHYRPQLSPGFLVNVKLVRPLGRFGVNLSITHSYWINCGTEGEILYYDDLRPKPNTASLQYMGPESISIVLSMYATVLHFYGFQ